MVVYFKVVNSTSFITLNLLFQPARVSEIHAVVSATKPLVTWTCRDAVQECREACGGHGYLKGFLLILLSCEVLCYSMFPVFILIMWPSCWSASGLGDLRNNFDASVTYEGDNNVLIQQTSNWLLRQWNKIREGEGVASPYNTVDFLSNATEILKKKFKGRDLQDVANHSCKYKQICFTVYHVHCGKQIYISWFQTFAVFWMLHSFFWVMPQYLNFMCQRFRTLSVPSS